MQDSRHRREREEVWWGKGKRKEDSLSQIWGGCAQHISLHFLHIPWQVVEVAPFLGDDNYEWRGMQGPSSPKFFKTTQKALSLPSFPGRCGYFVPLVGCWRQWENKEQEKRMILTRNNPFDFDGDLKMIENEV